MINMSQVKTILVDAENGGLSIWFPTTEQAEEGDYIRVGGIVYNKDFWSYKSDQIAKIIEHYYDTLVHEHKNIPAPDHIFCQYQDSMNFAAEYGFEDDKDAHLLWLQVVKLLSNSKYKSVFFGA